MSEDRDAGTADLEYESARRGLSPAQIKVLARIRDAKARHISYVSLHDVLSPCGNRKTAEILEGRGLVARRMIFDASVRLTELGRQVVESIAAEMTQEPPSPHGDA